jgi:type VI secretion system protein ImpC
MKVPEVPFYILAMAPLCPISEANPATGNVPVVSANSVDDAIAFLAPSLWISLPADICPDGGVNISPIRMRHLTPDGMIQSTPYLKELHDAAAFIDEAQKNLQGAGTIAEKLRSTWPKLPIDLSHEQETPMPSSGVAVDDILSMVAMPGEASSPSVADTHAAKWKKQLEAMLSSAVASIYACREFRVMEAAWRGIDATLKQIKKGDGGEVKMDIVSVSAETLMDVLVYLKERFIVNPPNLIIIDLPFENNPDSLEKLTEISSFGEMLLSPVVFWLKPSFFHLGGWGELGHLPYLGNYIDDARYAKWRNLRKEPAGRWLVAACNSFLIRPPFGNDYRPRSVFFKEEEPLWISPVWGLAMLIVRSMKKFGWPSRFTDYRNIMLEDLAVVVNESGNSISTETIFSDERIKQFIGIGITPLAGSLNNDIALMPHEATVAEGSLQDQLFFSFFIGFLLRCRDSFVISARDEDFDGLLREMLSIFFRQHGDEQPADLKIESGEGDRAGTILLDISFTPPKVALFGSQRIRFNFLW